MRTLKRLLDVLTKVCAWFMRYRKLRPTGVVKVNLGCGMTVAPGWWNIDGGLLTLVANLPTPVVKFAYRISRATMPMRYTEGEFVTILKHHRFVQHNLQYGVPFASGSVDFIFASHVIEHFRRADALKLLGQCRRSLRRGGVIRVTVPDLSHVLNIYRSGDKRRALSYFYNDDERYGEFDRHKYMYDFDLMRDLLMEAGFRDVRKCKYREGEVPDLVVLDNRPEETLFVEAAK